MMRIFILIEIIFLQVFFLPDILWAAGAATRKEQIQSQAIEAAKQMREQQILQQKEAAQQQMIQVQRQAHQEAEQQIQQISEVLGAFNHGNDVLYSTQILKKTGFRSRR